MTHRARLADWAFIINTGSGDKGPPHKAFKANLLCALIPSTVEQFCKIKSRMQLLLLFPHHFLEAYFFLVLELKAFFFFKP